MHIEDLEGVNLYDRKRLKDIGVVTVEQLLEKASDETSQHELAVQTGIPRSRITDWVGQAALHAGLKQYGIRTLSDLREGYPFILKSVERISKAEPGNVQQIAASQIELLTVYHQLVLDQARRSFRWALVAAAIGLIFFVSSVGFLLNSQLQNVAVISLISGALVEVVSGINFYLYGKTSSQLADFQSRLDMTQRFLLANSVCEGLDGEFKQRSRSELVRIIAAADRIAKSDAKEGAA